jgi:hypothetical protein
VGDHDVLSEGTQHDDLADDAEWDACDADTARMVELLECHETGNVYGTGDSDNIVFWVMDAE